MAILLVIDLAIALQQFPILWGKDTFLIWHLTGGTEGGLHITDVTNPPSAP